METEDRKPYGRTSRILVIEDEDRISRFIVEGLEADGHDVVAVQDGEVGLFMASTETFDAVVLDLGLPSTSGLEVLKSLKHSSPTLPIVVLTGYDDPAVRRQCIEAGAAAFVAKPLVITDFRAEVRAVLSKRTA
jgi:two-component system, OmpR family, response regulator